MRHGIDCAASTLGHAKQLRKAGVTFVCRYLSTPGNAKNVTRAEVKELHRYGIAVVLVFETTADRALGGALAGKQDGPSALWQAHEVGLPAAPVYFAVDFDMQATEARTVTLYFGSLRAYLGSRTGVYGGRNAVLQAMATTGITRAWQTYAWSGGQWAVGPQLRQTKNGVRVAGLDCDLDEAVSKDFGQTEAPLIRRIVYGLRYRHGIPYTEPV